MVNFYRKFICGAALLLPPLTDTLKGDPKAFSWSPKMDSSLSTAKTALAYIPSLVHPDFSAKISLAVDASDSHVGDVFQQLVCGSWAPLALFSKKLSFAESWYSAFDPELLAAYSTLRHFLFLLEGRDFTLFTDHKTPTHALFRVSQPWSARQQRHLSVILKFTSNLVHFHGSQNVVTDAFSHPSSLSLLFPALQPSCPETSSLQSNPSLRVVSIPSRTSSILCNLSTGSPCPLVPV